MRRLDTEIILFNTINILYIKYNYVCKKLDEKQRDCQFWCDLDTIQWFPSFYCWINHFRRCEPIQHDIAVRISHSRHVMYMYGTNKQNKYSLNAHFDYILTILTCFKILLAQTSINLNLYLQIHLIHHALRMESLKKGVVVISCLVLCEGK